MLSNFIIQLIGYVGLFFLILRFFYKKREKILFVSAIANFIYSVHWFFLGAFTGSGLTFISVIRSLIFQSRTSKKWADNSFWLYLFVIISLLIGYFTWAGYLSLLPLISTLMITFGSWSKSAKLLRILNTFAMVPWFVYAFLTGSQAVMISSTLIFISGIFNIMRFDYFQ